MRTRDDIWLSEEDRWGIDSLAWDEEEDGPPLEEEQGDPTPEDPRY